MRPMRPLLVTPLAAAITTGATTLTGLATPAGATTGSIWQVQTTVNPNATASFPTNSTLAGVSASGRDEAWAVGTFSNSKGVNKPLAEHWNGTSWAKVTVPLPAGQTSATLSGVDDLSPTNAWAVGTVNSSQSLTLIEHRNATSWSVVPSPSPATGIPGDGDGLTAIAGTGPNDLWAAGSDVTDEGGGEVQLLFEQFNGTSWKAVASPAGAGGGVASAITAITPDDFWAVGSFFGGGSNDLAAHWNGTKWSIVPVPNITTSGLNHLTGVSADGPDDVWASGFAARVDSKNLNVPDLLDWNGTSWTVAKVPTLGKEGSLLFGVQVLSPTDAWAVGQSQGNVGNESTLTEQFNGSVRTIVKSPDPGMEVSSVTHKEVPADTLDAVTGAGGGNLFAVGQRFAPLGHHQCCTAPWPSAPPRGELDFRTSPISEEALAAFAMSPQAGTPGSQPVCCRREHVRRGARPRRRRDPARRRPADHEVGRRRFGGAFRRLGRMRRPCRSSTWSAATTGTRWMIGAASCQGIMPVSTATGRTGTSSVVTVDSGPVVVLAEPAFGAAGPNRTLSRRRSRRRERRGRATARPGGSASGACWCRHGASDRSWSGSPPQV